MNDFNVEDVVLVYKDTPTFEDGAICQVIDRDPNDNSYAIADLRDIGKADRDISVILNRYVKWVSPENMIKLEFDKPKDTRILRYIQIFFRSFFFILSLFAFYKFFILCN